MLDLDVSQRSVAWLIVNDCTLRIFMILFVMRKVSFKLPVIQCLLRCGVLSD